MLGISAGGCVFHLEYQSTRSNDSEKNVGAIFSFIIKGYFEVI